MTRLRTVLLPILLATLVGAAAAAPVTYKTGGDPARTTIAFESKTDFEDILGSSTAITGTIVADESAPGASSVSLSVPARSLRTGIKLRDDHLAGPQWLDAQKNPNITFRSTKVEPGDKPGEVRVTGDFTMRGVTRTITVTAQMRRVPADLAAKAGLGPGEWARFSTAFDIKLSDFGIKPPAEFALKVADTISIRIALFASAT